MLARVRDKCNKCNYRDICQFHSIAPTLLSQSDMSQQTVFETGKNISPVELNITQFGIWLCVHDQEYFLSHEKYLFLKRLRSKIFII